MLNSTAKFENSCRSASTCSESTSARLGKGDPDAVNFFDNWILFNTSNGWIEARHDYWFKGNAWKNFSI